MNIDLLNKASTLLLAAGHIDEGVELDHAIQKMETIIDAKMVCPYCKAKLEATSYYGYYDEFDCWTCECDGIPVKNKYKIRGQYS